MAKQHGKYKYTKKPSKLQQAIGMSHPVKDLDHCIFVNGRGVYKVDAFGVKKL